MTRYRPFQVIGLELEYPVVGEDLGVVAAVEELFRLLHGRPTSNVVVGPAALSNELVAHVVELKNPEPLSSLVQAEVHLQEGLERTWEALEEELGLGFLPTGMHPTMTVEEGELWPRAGRLIYETYARVFDIRRHGWLNVQSCHVNLPFGDEAEVPLIHDALAMLLPYLPALAASSPLVEGEGGDALDMRLRFYADNQREIPLTAGDVVPRPMGSVAAYRRDVLGAIYAALREGPDSGRIRRDFVNSRGVIPKFGRESLEVRVLDMQECVHMDAAIAAFVRGAAHELFERLRGDRLERPPHEVLVEDYRSTVVEGRRAAVRAPHLGGPTSAGEVLAGLLPAAAARLLDEEAYYLVEVARILEEGSLSERILRELERRGSAQGAGFVFAGPEPPGRAETFPGQAGTSAGRAETSAGQAETSRLARTTPAMRSIYRELQACLRANRPWWPGLDA